MSHQINVALVGLGFGAEFIPIYQKHPNASIVAICQRSEDSLNKVGDEFNIELSKRFTSYDELLEDPNIDAVHINTPIASHAPLSIQALKAGKHVACTVPMATSVEECQQICELVEATGLTYMMMETVVYSREFLFVKELFDKGELGRIQYLQSSHQQDMDGWPSYWDGLPPMHYATHCVGPVLALQRNRAETLSCFGSGRIHEEMIPIHGSPFAIESCQVTFKDSDVSARIIRSLYNTARQYRESFDAYGSKKSYEWPLIEGEDPVIHTIGKPEPEIPERVEVPDYAHLLPEEIQPFTGGGVYDSDEKQHLSFTQGGGHGGSHPHLVHEFVSALLDKREPYPNAAESANITCVGILAHESAMEGGALKQMPKFTLK
ncbi:MAG: Gfo/Idh/MocA family oxidoreductase [Opitutales bacterium]|nr:Gfo/Idh/MocA family oxidoreductase [Opitutales bacterium]|tara:strand:+ start:113 stop:1243 length:1131 start_codon:yes stop_codon:yes gene_type:complete